MMRQLNQILLSLTVVMISACSSSMDSSNISTLYRSSVLDETARIHVATFDANESDEYNQGNCEQARQLFQSQSGVKTHFWCEMGRYKSR